ncbi:MAG TPA: uracil-DNA glycosylase [Bacteroidales bacterium]|nr:uracil-DNA glycosylase [Bacteroidales bacterium]HPS73839.1 uracil-DNA glycosylase [Bacteroidales bacterium]
MNPVIQESWRQVLDSEFNKPYFSSLKQFLVEEKKHRRVFPPGPFIFNAFNHTPFTDVKVVLIGQDPYHGYGQAHGLCFSVPDGVPKPPSLVNIFKELQSDLGLPAPVSGDLTKWTLQGVLLLNATLTVRENQAGSHQGKGWETFTDAAITALSSQREGLIFLLWGNFAISKRDLIDQSKHFILTAPHPSPLSASRGFFGCRHFSKTNDLLKGMGKEPIDWSL